MSTAAPVTWSTSTSRSSARCRPGGGWRVHGRSGVAGTQSKKKRPIGYCFVHSAVDDHSRLAYSEIHDDEQGLTVAAFWRRARTFFADHGVGVRAVLSDNGSCYRSQDCLKEVDAGGALPRRTRPYRPQTNGKFVDAAGVQQGLHEPQAST